jgi:hypothetical protein
LGKFEILFKVKCGQGTGNVKLYWWGEWTGPCREREKGKENIFYWKGNWAIKTGLDGNLDENSLLI